MAASREYSRDHEKFGVQINILQQRYAPEKLKAILLPRHAWRLFPEVADRPSIDKLLCAHLNQRRRAYIVGCADAWMDVPWPDLPATLYMDFRRTGSRKNYEIPYFERRQRLEITVLAELLEGQGRFLDAIVDGIWHICEEATWCLPAHCKTSSENDPLPLQSMEHVDLFACETARLLAETTGLLEHELNALSPAVIDRIRRQTCARVIEPVEARAGIYGFSSSSNWTSWRTANILLAALVHLDDPERLALFVYQLMGFMDKFLDGYAARWPDGGCAEGPIYWNVATGKLIEFLELLYSRSAGIINIYDIPLVREMCHFISRVHLAGPYFAAFADASPRPWLDDAAIYRAGERLGSEELKKLALYSMHAPDDLAPESHSRRRRNFASLLRKICWMPADAGRDPIAKPLEVWLPAIQIAVWRESAMLNQGMVVAAKAGNNHEPHNHNDVGQFIIMHDVYPIIVDIGAPEYSRETFSSARYDVFPIYGSAHNAPIVNGFCQIAGQREIRRAAEDVAFTSKDGAASLAMELSSCYDAAAGIKSLRRVLRFTRSPAPAFTLTDNYDMLNATPEIQLPLYAGVLCELTGPGEVAFKYGGGLVLMRFNQSELSASISKAEIADPLVRMNWPGGLWKVLLHHKAAAANGSYSLEFAPAAASL